MHNISGYLQYLNRLPISEHTRRAYLARVKAYLNWLEGTVDGDKAIANTVDRDFALRDYRVKLLQSGAKPATVNAALAALDNFYLFVGLGPAKDTQAGPTVGCSQRTRTGRTPASA